MPAIKKLQIIVSDNRQKYIAECLKKSNYIIYENNEYVKGDFDATILPMMYPYTLSILEKTTNSIFLGGNFKDEELITGKKNNNLLIDYFKNEHVKYENAFLTAEAAISFAISETDFSLKNSECLIIGFGRIGKLILKLLTPFSNNITVSARKDVDLALVNSCGYKSIHTEKICDISKFNIIFNTVPHLILNQEVLGTAKKDIFIIDLASKPGGTDFNYADINKMHCIHALGLPHKISPLSDARILSDSIIKIISERS